MNISHLYNYICIYICLFSKILCSSGDSTQNGGKSAIGRFDKSLLFTFNTNLRSDTVYIYLMETPNALEENGRFYYFKISNRNRYYNNYLYRCPGNHAGSYVNIEPNYGNHQCNQVLTPVSKILFI